MVGCTHLSYDHRLLLYSSSAAAAAVGDDDSIFSSIIVDTCIRLFFDFPSSSMDFVANCCGRKTIVSIATSRVAANKRWKVVSCLDVNFQYVAHT